MFLNVKNKQKKTMDDKRYDDLYIFVCFVKIDEVKSKTFLWETGSFLQVIGMRK